MAKPKVGSFNFGANVKPRKKSSAPKSKKSGGKRSGRGGSFGS